MLTKLTKTILAHDTELKKTWESLTPMGRMGDPEDLSVRLPLSLFFTSLSLPLNPRTSH